MAGRFRVGGTVFTIPIFGPVQYAAGNLATGRAAPSPETCRREYRMNTATTPLQYLDRAMAALDDMGLVPADGDSQEAPIVALLEQIAELDAERVAAIARTLDKASLFNDTVREQVQSMDVGQRYEEITKAFDSIRDDAKTMVQQVEDGRLDTFERVANVWMKATRGDIASRFDRIKQVYLDVTAATND
jgi:hypothetical protein